MARKVEVNESGLNIAQIGVNITTLENVTPIEFHVDRKRLLPWFENDFTYYFVKGDTRFIENVGLIKDIFISADKSNAITGIFLIIESSPIRTAEILTKIFGDAKLHSSSSIGGSLLGSKMFREKNNVSVFLSTTKNSLNAKLTISHLSLDEKMPGINFTY